MLLGSEIAWMPHWSRVAELGCPLQAIGEVNQKLQQNMFRRVLGTKVVSPPCLPHCSSINLKPQHLRGWSPDKTGPTAGVRAAASL